MLVANAFYENVLLHHAEGRDLRPGEEPRMVVVEFTTEPPQELLLACLWSHWTAPGEPDLLSFALITDDPPPEVAAAGHDRCVIALRPENLDQWLNPEERDTDSLLKLLDDRPPHLHYVHSRAT
ncbi:SOS response-associated peptidase family protein [Hydrogenophaga sp.]|uniref:SOS response-associated peptidase family protein n=1 Tax=Hydrogenophaga sp. TaxID=1904254 RepID=UPI0025B7D5DD|nr:SOS response-associated peptidase family protein [Hydrogenophaga sp.]